MPEQLTVFFQKDDDFGLLSMTTNEREGYISNIDTKHRLSFIQRYETPEMAKEWFAASIKTTQNNGWKLVCAAKPNNARLS